MANDIASQVKEKMESLEAAVFAMDHLASLASVVDNDTASSYANLHYFCSKHLLHSFESLNDDLVGHVLPFVRDMKAVKLG